MKENLLQYIWQFQYFNRSQLRLSTGEDLQIIDPGKYNRDQGPDFLNGRIRINDTTIAGNIEIHILSSSWFEHNHHTDSNYKNIILHVVWEEDKEIFINNLKLPTLTLQERVSKLLLQKYSGIIKNSTSIPCGNALNNVSNLLFTAWKQRLIIERLQMKSMAIRQILQQNEFHWEETFWRLLASNFGVKVNSNNFEAVAISLPYKLLIKHKSQPLQIEAILLGQCGLLSGNFNDQYPQMLHKEYDYLRKKYNLHPVDIPPYFLRMRPANFPTIRLSQLANLICKNQHFFSKIIELGKVKEILKILNVTANDYWHYHYMFDVQSNFKLKNIGKQMQYNIIINTIIPLLFTYGTFIKKDILVEKSLLWLEELSPEKNNITKQFEMLSIPNNNALDSQSLLHLKNLYCDKKRCLDCAVGNSILKSVSS